ncbi:MAG: POT-type proton-dependent oligopeptide transporter, partial [Chthoniobacterales bacterium]
SVYVFILIFWALWDMSNGVEWTLQAQKMDLRFLGMDLQAAQVQTANPILILLFIPLVNYVLYPFIDRFFPLTPLRKIGIGLFLTAGSFVVIVFIQHQIDLGLRPTIWWQMLAYVILTLGEAMVSITGLEFSYTQAPNSMKSSVMALWLFAVSAGNLFDAKFNAWDLNPDGTTKLTEIQFYWFFTYLMLGAAIVFVVVASFYKGRTHLQSQLTPDEIATEPMLAGGTPT